MSEYKLVIDEKVKLWRRDYVTVEADTLEEAIQKCLDCEYYTRNSEDLYDTIEGLDPNKEVGPTFEIYSEDNKWAPVYTNDLKKKCL